MSLLIACLIVVCCACCVLIVVCRVYVVVWCALFHGRRAFLGFVHWFASLLISVRSALCVVICWLCFVYCLLPLEC